MNDRNREQILGMQDLLDLYKDKQMPLHSLVNSLTAKANGMANAEPSWKAAFERNWLKLEICNALVLDAAETNTKTDTGDRERAAITEMKKFLVETLDKFPAS